MKRANVLIFTALLVANFAASERARAQPPAGSTASVTDDNKRLAKARFKQGAAFLMAGAYASAIEEFLAADQLFPNAVFHFNIAQAYRLKGDKPNAVAYYRKFLTTQMEGTDADEARAHVAKLTRAIEDDERAALVRGALERAALPPASPDQAAARPALPSTAGAAGASPVEVGVPTAPKSGASQSAPSPAAATPPSSEAPSRRSFAAPIAVGAVALAVVGAGLGTTLSVGPELQALQDRCQGLCDPAEADPLRLRAYVGYGLLGAGGALVVVDAVLFALAARRPEGRPPSALRVAPIAGPSLGGVQVVGSFR